MSMDADGERVLTAAWRVLERSNFETCKIERIMKEADVSARTFYRYFADKDELLLALMRDEMARSSLHLAAAVAAAAPVAEAAAGVGETGVPASAARKVTASLVASAFFR